MEYDKVKKIFAFNAALCWSLNHNKVEDLKGVESMLLNGFTSTGSQAVEGQPLGVLFWGRFERDASGKLVLDAKVFQQQIQMREL